VLLYLRPSSFLAGDVLRASCPKKTKIECFFYGQEGRRTFCVRDSSFALAMRLARNSVGKKSGCEAPTEKASLPNGCEAFSKHQTKAFRNSNLTPQHLLTRVF
jgi:hypothetical protein